MAKSHSMELPRLITIGDGNTRDLGGFLRKLGVSGTVSLVSGTHVQKTVGRGVERALERASMRYSWHNSVENRAGPIRRLAGRIKEDGDGPVVGIGGGRSVDVAKMAAFRLGRPFVSMPTAASHDGISSPFVSLQGDRPHSIVTASPHGVFVDIGIIRRAPPKLLASGCGDLVANLTAIRDWELGHGKTGEYYGRYAASLARMSADIIIQNAKPTIDERIVVEALISAGVAACIAGSSRPCSGSEHLFSHALDGIAPGRGLHGEKCGIGSIMMAKLQGQDWRGVRDALRTIGAPTTAKEIGLGHEQVVAALVSAQDLRPKRHTVLAENNMTERRALALARGTGVLQ